MWNITDSIDFTLANRRLDLASPHSLTHYGQGSEKHKHLDQDKIWNAVAAQVAVPPEFGELVF